MAELVNGRVVQPSAEKLREQYPNSPALWKSLAPQVELSADRARRAAQIQFPASPGLWPAERDLAKEYDQIEAEVARVAQQFPLSAPDMVAPMINHAANQVRAELWELELDARRAELHASREAAATPPASEE